MTFPLTTESIKKNVESRSGVYQILWFKDNAPKQIGRLLHTDKRGIISIGSSLNLKRRLSQFIRARGIGWGHSSGSRIYWYELDDILGEMDLRFKVMYANDFTVKESKLLIGYTDKFGELPPMNHQDCKEIHFNFKPIPYPKGFEW